jgi:ATP/maltotriose-dependent transcriptional regulator MalT/DNA-binding SARP family transcriptional activator
VARPGLAAALRRAAGRGLVTVVAGPGWGKSTLVASLARDEGLAWYVLDASDRDARSLAKGLLEARGADTTLPATESQPEALASLVLERWAASDPGGLVLDEVDVLDGSEGADLLHAVTGGLPAQHRLVVSARRDPDLVDERQRAAGSVLELDANHLALDVEAVSVLLVEELDQDDPLLAARIVEVTGGWPAAVRLVVDALHDVAPGERTRRLATLTDAAGPVSAYVRGVVLPEEDELTQALVARLALLERVDVTLLSTVTGLDTHDAIEAGARLVSQGLAVRDADETGDEAVRLAPAVRAAVLERVLPDRDDGERLVDEVVGELLADGAIEEGLVVLTTVDRPEDAASLLEEHGSDLLHAGALEAVTDAAAAIPDEARSRRIERLHGQALAFRGEWSAALRCLDAAGATADGPLPLADAIGLGLVHHLRGDLDAALEAYRRAPGATDESDDPAVAELAAWRSTAHWLRGESDDATDHADTALAIATRTADDRALALAHTAQALVAASRGDRRANENHYRQALTAARRAGDVLQQARILTNLGSLYLEQGQQAAALEATDEAIDLADSQGFAMVLAIARCNRADLLLRTGAIDEAIADAEFARDLFARIGSRHEAYAHHLLGDARREQGDLALARQAYERALRLAEPSGDKQGRIPALVGLARTLAATDPDAASAAVQDALAHDDGMARADALAAAGWVALARGDRDAAVDLATEAAAFATAREDLPAVAESTTLLAVLAEDPAAALRDAAALWWQVGAGVSATRVELGAARRSSDPAERVRAEQLERRLRSWGCAVDEGAYAHRAVVAVDARPRTTIRLLGGFAVEHDGRPVAHGAWGSRKARDLVKVLAVRAGRGVPREELADLLWPGEPYEAVGNRLSVALSVARSVLADGQQETLVHSDGTVVRLDLERVDLDVERFWRLAVDGLASARRGDTATATTLLASAEEAYVGDLLEDDRDALWLVDRREELRSTYVSVARTLAEASVASDPDLAMRLLLRVLDRDPYDEPAHLGVCQALLRAGRHGEARRRHRLYEQRMEELDLPAVQFHQLDGRIDRGARRSRTAGLGRVS